MSVSLKLVLVPLYALIKRIPVYGSFTAGAEQGFSTAVMIIPYLVTMLCAIGMFRASGAMDWLVKIIEPLTNLIGMPGDVLPMGIMRTLSGGAAEGMLADLLKQFGTQSQIGRIASVATGSTETTFYIVAVYFGSVGVKNTRYSILAGLLGDAAGLIASTLIVNAMWNY